MHKIFLIIKREYLVRVRKKSFIVMTLLAPLLMAGLIIIPAVLALESKEKRLIAVYEEGAPQLERPPTPILTLVSAAQGHVEFIWDFHIV